MTHAHFLDPYRPRASLIHALDPRVKFLLAVGFILAAALTPPAAWAAYILLAALALAATVLSELGVGYVLRRSGLALPFVLAAFPVLFTLDGAALLHFRLGPLVLTLSDAGLVRFVSIALKSWLSVQAAIVLAGTTPFPELLLAMRSLRIPRLLVAIIGLMWRYLFVLADEALRLMRARAARSAAAAEPGRRVGGTVAWRARVTGGMAGNLFLRSFDRADRIYNAMAARGYDGEVRMLPIPRVPLGQRVLVGLALAGLALVVLLGYLL
ncbi:MAG: Nickel transport protein NikQ [Chloroflexi bacterium ADurb.Bin325]|nr:MAG: Nickel transport protein NikQ [Chloroflexi bacterium ADurb.Bin325]